MANRPIISGTLDLTPDVLNAAKKAGPNQNGNYSFKVAVWDNDKRTKDTSPHFTGSVTVKDMEDSPRGYASIWDNREGGNSVTVKTSAASSDDLF
jgi:hypothetical protein